MKWIEKIESWIFYSLIVMLTVCVILGTIDLGRSLIKDILQPPFLLIDPHALFDAFGLFLVILIGLELLKLLKLHVSRHALKPELVIEVAIIAVCNKIVTLDLKSLPFEILLGFAALILALSVGYYAFSKARSDA